MFDKMIFSGPMFEMLVAGITFLFMGFSLLSASEFLPTEKWRCAKQQTICYAGGTTNLLYKKITFPLK